MVKNPPELQKSGGFLFYPVYRMSPKSKHCICPGAYATKRIFISFWPSFKFQNLDGECEKFALLVRACRPIHPVLIHIQKTVALISDFNKTII